MPAAANPTTVATARLVFTAGTVTVRATGPAAAGLAGPEPRELTTAVAVLLALGAALTYGTADFLGGVASRRGEAMTVVVVSQLLGVFVLLAAIPFLPAATYGPGDLAWGAVGGLFGGIGLTCFFRAFAVGAMSVVAPITAVIAAGVPVAAGLGFGERPGLVATLGIVVAFPAIVLVSRQPAEEPAGVPPAVLGLAIAAGVSFGLFFVLLERTGEDSGVIPLVASRAVSVLLIGTIAAGASRLESLPIQVLRVALVSGLLDMIANVLYLLAVREGLLVLVAVVTSLYPGTTVLLARTVLGERLAGVQVTGLAVATGAVTLVALG